MDITRASDITHASGVYCVCDPSDPQLSLRGCTSLRQQAAPSAAPGGISAPAPASATAQQLRRAQSTEGRRLETNRSNTTTSPTNSPNGTSVPKQCSAARLSRTHGSGGRAAWLSRTNRSGGLAVRLSRTHGSGGLDTHCSTQNARSRTHGSRACAESEEMPRQHKPPKVPSKRPVSAGATSKAGVACKARGSDHTPPLQP